MHDETSRPAEANPGGTRHPITPSNNSEPQNGQITPKMLPLIQLDQQQIDTIVRSVTGGASNVQDVYPLSPLQEGMLFHHLLSDSSDNYVLSTLFEVDSEAQLGPLSHALQKVIDRHDVLRTAVLWEQLTKPVQVVYRRAALQVSELTLRSDRDPVEQLQELMRPGAHRLELRRAPMGLLQVTGDVDGKRYALLRLHHLVCDHQSLRTVVAEAMACLNGREQALPRPVAFRNYVAQALEHAETPDAEAFFRSKLEEVDEPTAPFGLLDVHGNGTRIEEARRKLDPSLALKIRTQARRVRTSAARLFHAAWALVVARTSGRDDVVYGTVVLASLQRSTQAQRMLGMSVNTLPLRLRLRDVTVRELVEQTHRELSELLKYEHAPLILTQRCSGIAGTGPLFTTLLNYRRSEPDADVECRDETGVRWLAQGEAWTNYPITLLVDDLLEGFVLTVQTDWRIDPHRILGYLEKALESLAEGLEQAPVTPALALSILPDGERRQLIEQFNATNVPYPQDALIHKLFEGQVQRTPQAVAVVYQDESLTYAVLNERSNQVARQLRHRGVGPDQLVAIYVERGLEMVIGLLGILKAGGAYVPLDPSYPAERLAYMLHDCAPRVVLTQQQLRQRLPQTAAKVIELDGGWSEIAQQATSNLDSTQDGLRPHHLAYVIYTSGSTGRPKGVMVKHAGVVNFLASMQGNPGISATDCMLAVTTVSFDIAALEIYLPLTTGAKLVLASREVALDASLLMAAIARFAVTVVQATPATWQLLMNGGWNGRSDLKVWCGGEALTTQLSAEILQRSGSLWNLYGPTETTIWSCTRRIEAAYEHGPVEPIGGPISNTQLYILDDRLQAVPVGVPGEIYIAGAGVARGYLNRPDLTAERFVPNSFSTDPGARMYKTGDLGRWRADDSIEYLGRNDHQVKIRGFRIELGEIERQLTRHTQVKAAVVIAREDVAGEKRLVAYVVPSDSACSPTVEELRAHLKAMLPEYMVPSACVMLDRMPLTPNGKLDRRSLPAPELEAYARRDYEAPQGDVEEIVAQIWQSLLRVERVGRQDNFFELGGHSILAMQAAARIQSCWSIDIPIRLLFEFPTLRELSDRLDGLRSARLIDRIIEGGSETEELLDTVTSLSERKVQELLRELAMEGRP